MHIGKSTFDRKAKFGLVQIKLLTYLITKFVRDPRYKAARREDILSIALCCYNFDWF